MVLESAEINMLKTPSSIFRLYFSLNILVHNWASLVHLNNGLNLLKLLLVQHPTENHLSYGSLTGRESTVHGRNYLVVTEFGSENYELGLQSLKHHTPC